jgi:hypothetical protein
LRAIAEGEAGGDIAGDLLRSSTAGRKDKDRTKVSEDRPDDGSGDVALDAGRLTGL